MKKAKELLKLRSTDESVVLSSPMYMKRNVHRQCFTPEQEKLFAQSIKNIIASGYRLVSKEVIRQEAKRYWETLHPSSSQTRSSASFHASDGWIQRFKGRHGFTQRAPKMVKKLKFSENDTREAEALDYMCEVEEAVWKHGPDCVINLFNSLLLMFIHSYNK
jgi:hypothetical protein